MEMFYNFMSPFTSNRDMHIKNMVKKLLQDLAPKMVDKVHKIDIKDTYRYIEVLVHSHKCKHILNYSHGELNTHFKKLFDEKYKQHINKEVILVFVHYDPFT